jgi:hypothetical protein
MAVDPQQYIRRQELADAIKKILAAMKGDAAAMEESQR